MIIKNRNKKYGRVHDTDEHEVEVSYSSKGIPLASSTHAGGLVICRKIFSYY